MFLRDFVIEVIVREWKRTHREHHVGDAELHSLVSNLKKRKMKENKKTHMSIDSERAMIGDGDEDSCVRDGDEEEGDEEGEHQVHHHEMNSLVCIGETDVDEDGLRGVVCHKGIVELKKGLISIFHLSL